MRLGLWCPAPLSMRPVGRMTEAFANLTRHGGGPGPDESYAFALDTLRRAEDLGFEITLIAQRFLGPDLDSWVVASALAVQTRSMQIMAAVHPGIMDPRITAKLGASIDRLSGGRFCVNIVNGGRPQEFGVFGKWIESSEPRYRRMQEFIQVLRGMWTSEDFTFHGEFYQVEHGTVPTKSVRDPHPPIYAASRVDEGMKVVSEECDTWFVNYSKDYRDYEQSLKRIETERAMMEDRVRSLGRRMGYGINAAVIMADTDAQAQAIADDWVAELARNPSIFSASGGLGAGLVGSRQTILERMRRYLDMGVDLFMLQPYPMRDGLEALARDVLPDLRKSHGPRADAALARA
jgi:FMNH2-dependent dimethyl sulfone monooxygenase